jgi:hypothetical protein
MAAQVAPAAMSYTFKLDDHYLRFQANRPIQVARTIHMLRKTRNCQAQPIDSHPFLYSLTGTFSISRMGGGLETTSITLFQVDPFQCG